MKRDAGWATVVVALATGLSLIASKGGGSQLGGATGNRSAASTAARQASADLYRGTCHELRSTFSAFLHKPEQQVPAPASCGVSQAKPQPDDGRDRPQARFVIATLADPTHTHLPLIFDRDAEAIQQAAADSGYVFDSSWFPWETEAAEHPLIADQDIADNRKEDREDQPGVLLFRKATEKDDLSDPYADILVVFVVGEEPTAGVHSGQFENAVQWIGKLSAVVKRANVKILGPSFSGSFPSLRKLLMEPATAIVLKGKEPLEIGSGHVTSSGSVDWFVSQSLPGPFTFQSFQTDDKTSMSRFENYLNHVHIGLCRVAIVSEDETTYGQISSGDIKAKQTTVTSARDADNDCDKFAFFYYPRDIASVRSAYQEQSLFNPGSSQEGTDLARHTLKGDLADPEGKEHDTIQSYGANQTVLSDEGVLLQLVNMLRMHKTYYIVLRGSNPLDQIFLAHFFQMTYPEGRVVFLGADLLQRRDLGSGGLNGALLLSTYPLLPDIDHWTRRDDGSAIHAHRAEPQASAQGTYTAMRFLLPRNRTSDIQIGQMDCVAGGGSKYFLPQNKTTDPLNPDQGLRFLPDYSNPAWFEQRTCQPVTWLTVLGNDGFWPVASLDKTDREELREDWGAFDSAPFQVWRSFEAIFFPPQPLATFRPVPLSMNIAIAAVILWMAFHMACCWRPSVTMKPDHRSYFVRMRRYRGPSANGMARPKSQSALIVGMSAIVVCIFFLLASGWGWMSDQGAPIPHPRRYGVVPLIVWVMGAAAVLGNSIVETVLPLMEGEPSPFRILWARGADAWEVRFRVLRESFKPLASYTLLTWGFYCFFLLLVDSTLPPQVKTLTYLRSMKLTTGVSPVVPMVFLALGLYGWCWSSLRGLALFGADRPRLPKRADLMIPVDDKPVSLLAMLSQQDSEEPIERICWPFHRPTWLHALIALLTLQTGTVLLGDWIPLRSLGTQHYSGLIWFWIAINVSLLLANAWQLMQLWLKLKSLLIFLDKLPLRRTMQAIDEFSWGSIWRIGGNVLDWRYKLFYREFETLNHLRTAFAKMSQPPQLAATWIDRIEQSRKVRIAFQKWSSDQFTNWRARDLSALRDAQRSMARLCGQMIVEILVPAWTAEDESLLIRGQAAGPTPNAEDGDRQGAPASGRTPYVRHAEEAVSLLYLGFIQNVLGRIRTLVMGMVCLFLSIAFVVPSYPFDPRPLLTGAVIVVFLVVGVVVYMVYSQMFRDATLSHLTNTRPGELGSEFWLKLLEFGAGPVLGLLATVFPEFGTAVLSWVQPSLSSIK